MCVLSTVSTDGFVPIHQVISIQSADWPFVVLDLIYREI